MELREYQAEALRRLKQSLKKGNRRIILALATGAGKSILGLSIVKSAAQRGNYVLYVAHRTILIEQMQNTLKNFKNVVVESVQRSNNRYHDDIKILIIDEVHYGVNSSVQNRMINRYPDAIVIGLSATPMTASGHKIEGWDDVIDVIQLKELVDMGFLAKLKILAPMHINTSEFKISAGEYNQKDVAKEVTKTNIIHNVVEKYIKYADGLKSVFYAVNIEHAAQLNAELIERGYKSAVYHSKLKKEVKKQTFNAFKDNKLLILVSVESLTTGFDLPDLYCGVLATPTKSIIKAVQIYGRFARLDANNPNKEALILDCSNVIEDTVHPYQKLDFNRTKQDTRQRCVKCDGGIMQLIKKSATQPTELGEYTVAKILECNKCGYTTVKEEQKIIVFNFCEECETIIKPGTAATTTRKTDKQLQIISICPHCANEKIMRNIGLVDTELEEKKLKVNINAAENWEDVLKELRKAKNKDGKKYHHLWAKRSVDTLKEEGFSLSEVKKAVNHYVANGWKLGGIVNNMIKRRGKFSNY